MNRRRVVSTTAILACAVSMIAPMTAQTSAGAHTLNAVSPALGNRAALHRNLETHRLVNATSQTLLGMSTDVDPSGRTPVLQNGGITSVVGGGNGRSEVFWNTADQRRIELRRYATVTAEFDVWHQLRESTTNLMPSKNTWHVLFQLHGPTLANTWPGPPFTIAWQNGTYRLGGGAAVPDSSGVLRFKGSWFTPYPSAPDRTKRRFKVQSYLDGPGSGWVSVWIDGVQYLKRWKPVAGTFYTNAGNYSHKNVRVKTGLYTGTQSPAWTRRVIHQNVRLSWTLPSGVTTNAAYL